MLSSSSMHTRSVAETPPQQESFNIAISTRNGGSNTSSTSNSSISSSRRSTSTMCRTSRIISNIIMISLILIVIVSILHIVKLHLDTQNNLLTSSTSKSYLIESLSEFTKQQKKKSSDELVKNVVDDNPLLRVITAAGVIISDTNTTNQLPSVYQAMKQQYGDMRIPIIHGMERCRTYQQNVLLEHRIVGVAGMFNTGTNAMEYHLRENLKMIKSVWQVPWGKHRVPYVRLQHVAPGMDKIQQEHVLPIIMIRDPFHWMQSMCKSQYAAHWKKTRVHCPNLVPTRHDIDKFHRDGILSSKDTFNVTVNFDTNQVLHWKSLIHLYNDWYQQYYTDATYPRLIVRFEDMLLHAPTIVRMIGSCVGIDNITLTALPFKYQVKSAKDHGSHTDFIKAILKSGNVNARIRNMTTDDIQFAATHLDKKLMEAMHYILPETAMSAIKE